MTQTLFTIGYAGHTLDSLVEAVQSRGAVLCDIRYRAWSQREEWRPATLRGRLGVSYWECPELGNLHYADDGPMELARPNAVLGMMRSTLQGWPVVLMCGCRDHTTCHRSMAAAWLAERIGCPVEHLPPAAVSPREGAGIPALTLTPPWGSLIAVAAQHPELGKRFETRSWSTSYRGPLAIHQAKGLADLTSAEYAATCVREPFRAALRTRYEQIADIPRGAIVALAELVAVHPTEEIAPRLSEVERAFGDYSPGRYAWELAEIVAVDPPIPARGAQGLWRWVAPSVEEVTG